MNSQELYTLIKDNNLSGLLEIIQNAPPANNKEFSIQLLQIGGPLAILNALSPLCIEYTFGKNCEFGVELSKAALLFAKETYHQQDGDMPLMLMTVSRFALNAINGLNTLGQYNETLDLLEEHLDYFIVRNAKENISSIILAKVYALLNLNRIDEAEEILNSLDPNTIEWDASIEYDRLVKLIGTLKRTPHSLHKDRRSDQVKNLSPFSGLITKPGSDNWNSFLELGTAFLTGEGEEMNQWKADSIVRKATNIFLGKPSREQIKQSLEKLIRLRVWTKQSGTASSDNDVLWGLYLCLNRLKEFSEAADVLLEMQKNHERLRSNIKNPDERAGVYSLYKHFFGALCKMLLSANRIPELLNAIESSKGRAVADILTQKTDGIVPDYQISGPVNELMDFCKQKQFHYLTYFVDDEEVFAVLVTRTGKLYSSGVIEISKQDLRRATLTANPENWGRIIFRKGMKTIIPQTSESVSPLVQWLESFLDKHILEEDDHICYSPDENIFNIPLHYLAFKGKELLDFFSVSRVHGAYSLMLAFEEEAIAYDKFVSFLVPTKQDKANQSSDGVYQGLLKTNDFLSNILSGDNYVETEATKNTVIKTRLQHMLVHFGTHGIFPLGTEHRDQNPFRGSGLLLSGDHELPDKVRISSGQDMDSILTPEDIFNSKVDLAGSHVTMQACVSGLSTEGIGGDAIGLEWTMLLAGASSILSTHWNIGPMHSYLFIKSFYNHWIVNKESKAVAWRKAILELKNSSDPELSSPYVYAAYSITGNWN